MKQTDELVTIYWATSVMEGELVRGRLEAEGIPALVAYDALTQTVLGGTGQAQVRVPEKFAQRARELLRTAN